MSESCYSCRHLGLPVDCKCCAGGKGWPCLLHPPQHVHPDMHACKDWEDWMEQYRVRK